MGTLSTLTGVIVSILPLVLIASVSPVIFLNASTATANAGQKGGWYFVLGNAIVLVVLGAAFAGVLGTTATSFAQREIASRTVDRMLAIVLLLYGGYLAWTKWRTRTGTDGGTQPVTGGAERTPGDLISWGALGMATNFTSLPIIASVSQRVGASAVDWPLRILVLAAVLWCVLTPAWLPPVMSKINPRQRDVSPRTRATIAHWTGVASIAACVVGGIALAWTSR